MKYEICNDHRLDEALMYTLNLLPKHLSEKITAFFQSNQLSYINEIRFHRGGFVSFIANSKNVRSSIRLCDEDLSKIIVSLCGGSVYAHFNTIKNGYISLGMGIRVGICGHATVENGDITAISRINSINIRIPRRIYHSADYLYEILKADKFQSSVILYSRPGVGKTSILRELIYLLGNAEEPIRHAVIDTREEITTFMEKELMCADIFISYPKGQGIEIATKSMTPEIIICDEISSIDEAIAITRASNSGVRLIATAHASSYDELLTKEILKPLFNHKIFNYALGIERENGSCQYNFTLNSLR